MNNQNRTADGRIASKKEAQRTDCIEMITRYRFEAKEAVKDGAMYRAKYLVDAINELKAAFFADYAEAV